MTPRDRERRRAGIDAASSVGEAVVGALESQGCRYIFGLPGSHVLEIYAALGRHQEICHVTVKNEATASVMADVYGRLTGRPGVCLLTAGPGALNSVNGVAQAFSANSPMIHITGGVPIDSTLEAFHGADDPEFVRRIFEPITKWSVRVTDATATPEIVAEAFRVAVSGRPGPVHIEFPRFSDTSDHLITDAPLAIPPYRRRTEPPPQVGGAAFDSLLERIAEAERPVICAGKGVVRAGAERLVEELSSALGAPIVFPQEAIGVVPDDHPYSVGYVSIWTLHPFIETLLGEADLVLGLGIRPKTGIGDLLQRVAGPRLVCVDWDGNDEEPAVVGGSIQPILNGLVQRLPRQRRPESDGLLEAIRDYKTGVLTERSRRLEDERHTPGPHPGRVVSLLADVLEDRPATIVSDVGDCAIWLRNYLPNRRNLIHLQSGMWNSMGFALPGALVSKLVDRDRVAIGVLGDGALLMTMNDLGTLVEQGANSILIVFNDRKYQQIERMLQRTAQTDVGTVFTTPDLVELATSFGLLGLRARTEDEFRHALQEALRSDRPALIDVHAAVGCSYPTFEFNTQRSEPGTTGA